MQTLYDDHCNKTCICLLVYHMWQHRIMRTLYCYDQLAFIIVIIASQFAYYPFSFRLYFNKMRKWEKPHLCV